MATVFYFLPEGSKPTPEEIEEIRALKNRPIVFDEDCMPISDEKWEYYKKLMKKYNTRRITKEILIAEGKIKAAS